MGRISAWDRGMLSAKEFKTQASRIRKGVKPINFGGRVRNIPREKTRRIVSNMKKAKAGRFLSSRRLNNQWLGGFFSELKKDE